MIINDIFIKKIDRNIDSVVTLSSFDNDNEIYEYVVTDEIYTHICTFLDLYKKNINNKGSKIGVWISGFFGSGKSHFLKILYYILKNIRQDILIQNNENLDIIKEDLKQVGELSKDVILFNIDAKYKKGESLVDIFLKCFNEVRGFCVNYPFIAEFEKRMIKDSKYIEFKEKIRGDIGDYWEDVREKFYILRDEILKVVCSLNNWTYDECDYYFLSIEKKFSVNIESFSNDVKDYIKSFSYKHQVVFMIDEVSQFISGDTNKMLNLQTIVEELSKKCFGQVLVVVSSHNDILSMTEQYNEDFSKIQGRFDTKIFLSSINIDEIIYRRFLIKKETTLDAIKNIYSNQAINIRQFVHIDSLYNFSDTMSKQSFVKFYPFLNYSLKFLINIIKSFSDNNVIGKDISKGERSVMNFIQKTLIDVRNNKVGYIVPLYKFYDALEEFINLDYREIFLGIKFEENIEEIDIQILKVLFLIRYIDEVFPTINTILSFVIDSVDNTKFFVSKYVEKSLEKLAKHNYVNKDGDNFYFLSKYEKSIHDKISDIDITVKDVGQFVCNEIFESIIDIKTFKYRNRVNFKINKILDDITLKGFSKDNIGIKFVVFDNKNDSDILRINSINEQNIIVFLKESSNLFDEVSKYLKMYKYLDKYSFHFKGIYKDIIFQKEKELINRIDRIHILIKKLIESSDIYGNGQKLEFKGDYKNKINSSLEFMVNAKFNKFNYIKSFILNNNQFKTVVDGESQIEEIIQKNNLAAIEIYDFIDFSRDITLKEILKHFSGIPYGFDEKDILVILIYFLKTKKITMSQECDMDFNAIKENVLDKKISGEIVLRTNRGLDTKNFTYLKNLAQEFFLKKYVQDDFNEFMLEIKSDFNNTLDKLKRILECSQKNYKYPSRKYLEEGFLIVQKFLQCKDILEYFKENEDFLFDFFEDLEEIDKFYNSNNFNIFHRGIEIIEIFNKDKTYLDKEFYSIIGDIEFIIEKKYPYKDIFKLKNHSEKFEDEYKKVLYEIKEKVDVEIREILKGVNCLDEILLKLYNANCLFDVYGLRYEAFFIKEKKLQ